MARSRHARKQSRERSPGDRNGNGDSRTARRPSVEPRTIPVRLATGAEGIVLHQRVVSLAPVSSGADARPDRRYLLKEVFE